MRMHLIHLLVAGLVPGLGFALSRRAVDCLFATIPGNAATCESFASSWGLSVTELQELNPGITCPNLDPSGSFCVIGSVIEDPPGTTLTTTASTTTSISTTTTTTTTTRTTTTSTRSTTTTTQPPTTTNPTDPTPTMPGIADNCDGFYKISSGDQCSSIAQRHGVTIAQLRSWNSEINAECSNLWLDYYICVHVPGVATSTSTTITTTTLAPGTGPTPQQSGIISSCNKYHLVESGDGCASITSSYGISLANFYNWNPAVGSSCGSLWLGYYVCVGTSTSQSTTTTTTTTTKSTTTATTTTATGPSPTQSGLVKTCTSFYKAAAGDTCDVIAKQKYPYINSIPLFVRWNPAVGDSCTNLLSGYYYCVATDLHQPMPGIINSCKRYYQVKAGDTCFSIQQKYGITAAQFNYWNPTVGSSCTSLWQGYFVCIGV
ncbi:hypothetical protein BJX65DRAFT_285046 [Aspergillus insuetus]